MPKPFNGRINLDVRDSVADWDAFTANRRPRGRRTCSSCSTTTPARRRGRRTAGGSRCRRMDRLAANGLTYCAVAHDGAVLADALDLPHRPQPPLQRLRLDLRVGQRLPRLQLPHPAGERDARARAARGRLQHVLGRQEPQHAGRRLDAGLVEEGVAARPGLRPLLRLHRRRDQQLVSGPRRGQPLHRPALPARGRLPPLQGPGRQGAALHPRHQAVRARQALVPVVLPGRQPRARTTRRRSSSTSTRASSTTATRPTASGCCRA